MSSSKEHKLKGYWERDNLGQAILDLLTREGKDLDKLTIDDLALLDHFHSGGKGATLRLASLANLESGTRVLDVGGGIGGAARTLAAEFGCYVTTIDLTKSYVETASLLTHLLGLDQQVKHYTGDALELPFDDGSFDIVWTQSSGMNISDKKRLYAGFHRVLREKGLLVFQEPMAGIVQPIIFPVMWALDESKSFLLTSKEMCQIIENTGFYMQYWNDFTDKTLKPSPINKNTIQYLIMGEHLKLIIESNHRNSNEDRVIMVEGIFQRV